MDAPDQSRQQREGGDRPGVDDRWIEIFMATDRRIRELEGRAASSRPNLSALRIAVVGLVFALFAVALWAWTWQEIRMLARLGSQASLDSVGEKGSDLSLERLELRLEQCLKLLSDRETASTATSQAPAGREDRARKVSSSGFISGKPAVEGPLETQPSKPSIHVNLDAVEEWNRHEMGEVSTGEDAQAPATLMAEPAESRDGSSSNGLETVTEISRHSASDEEELDSAALSAELQELLEDAGLGNYRLLEGRFFRNGGMREALLGVNDVYGAVAGTISAERIDLVLNPADESGSLVLREAEGMLDGTPLQTQGGIYRIHVPGKLPRHWIPNELGVAFGMDPCDDAGVIARKGERVEQLLAQYQKLLTRMENHSLRMLALKGEQDGDLIGAVYEIAWDSKEPVRTIHAGTSWFELDTVAATVELCCEGGEIESKGQRRPLFKGRFRHVLSGIDPEAWIRIQGVRPRVRPADKDGGL